MNVPDFQNIEKLNINKNELTNRRKGTLRNNNRFPLSNTYKRRVWRENIEAIKCIITPVPFEKAFNTLLCISSPYGCQSGKNRVQSVAYKKEAIVKSRNSITDSRIAEEQI